MEDSFVTDSQLQSYARMGAAVRRSEILAELADLDAFLNLTAPEEDPNHTGHARRLTGAPSAAPTPRRRTMSAEARALISAAQKARWAKQKRQR